VNPRFFRNNAGCSVYLLCTLQGNHNPVSISLTRPRFHGEDGLDGRPLVVRSTGKCAVLAVKPALGLMSCAPFRSPRPSGSRHEHLVARGPHAWRAGRSSSAPKKDKTSFCDGRRISIDRFSKSAGWHRGVDGSPRLVGLDRINDCPKLDLFVRFFRAAGARIGPPHEHPVHGVGLGDWREGDAPAGGNLATPRTMCWRIGDLN
jgi:hypothetical protein